MAKKRNKAKAGEASVAGGSADQLDGVVIKGNVGREEGGLRSRTGGAKINAEETKAVHESPKFVKSRSQPAVSDIKSSSKGLDAKLERAESWAPGQRSPESSKTQKSDAEVEAALNLQGKTTHELFACGLAYEAQGDIAPALACFRRCLRQGVETTDGQAPLPSFPGDRANANTDEPEGAQLSLATCIRKISNLLAKRDEYELALGYRQAEKLLYEKALLSVIDLQDSGDMEATEESEAAKAVTGEQIMKELYGEEASKMSLKEDISSESIELIDRANTYQILAELFFSERVMDCALDYANKAVKLKKAAELEISRKVQTTEVSAGEGSSTADMAEPINPDESDPAIVNATLVDKLMHFSSGGKQAYEESMKRYLQNKTETSPKVSSTIPEGKEENVKPKDAAAKAAEVPGSPKEGTEETTGAADGASEDTTGLPLPAMVSVFALVLAIGLGIASTIG